MPELPEVETIRRGLEGRLEGRSIRAVRRSGQRLRRPLQPALEALEGGRFTGVRRRGKYLVLDLAGGDCLVVHLGMTGRLLLQETAERQASPHDHLVLDLDGGSRLVFSDARRFGFVDLVRKGDDHPFLAGMGPEPLDRGFTSGVLMERAARTAAGRPCAVPVKSRLLDQAVVAGVGNIYACEALHGAGVDPRREAASLSAGEYDHLAQAIRAVLAQAIRAGGTTLKDYRGADGAEGGFQAQLRVYGREGCPCMRPGCPGTVERIVQAQRATFFCPVCQA